METHTDSDGYLCGSSYRNTLQAVTGAATLPSSMVRLGPVQPEPLSVVLWVRPTGTTTSSSTTSVVLNAGGNQFVRRVSATLVKIASKYIY